MHHLLSRALAGSVLLFASNSVLAHEDALHHASATTTTKAKGQESGSPQLIDPGFTARELKTRASTDEIVKLRKVPMPDGTTIDADLTVWTPFGPDCALQFSRKGVAGKSVQRVLEMKDVTFLKGHVRGKKDSVVMIAAKDDRMEGFFSYEGTTARITRDTSQPTPKDVILPGLRPDGVLPPEGVGCGMSFEDLSPGRDTSMAAGGLAGGLAGAAGDCHLIRIALELDYELYANRLNEDGLATLVYVAKLLYTTDEVIRRDLGAQIELASVNVWTEPDDPWISDYFSAQLEEFIDYCNDPSNHMLDIPRDATMLLSGRAIGGGKAGGIGALSCDRPERAYLVCGHLSGDFPYPAVMNHDDNWDILHFIHEFGHLLNGLHTHTLDPPVDTCGTNCSEPQRGSAMSYCHHCPGGDKNRGLWFHMRNQDRARGYLDTIGCLEGREASIAAYDDEAFAYRNSGTRIDVLQNDGTVCSGAFIHGNDAFSTEGGLVRRLQSAGPMGRDVLQYLPPRDFVGADSFSYQAIDGFGNTSMAQVVVEVEPAPFLTDPEYLVVDLVDRSISRFDAETHEFKGDFVPEFPEFLDMPSSILPLPDTSVLVGDRSLGKVLQLDINGEYQGVFFEHHDLIHCEAMVRSGEQVFILDAYGGWIFRTGFSGGYQGALFEGTGTGADMTVGDDGTLWVIGSVNGNEVIGIDPETGEIRHAIADLEGIDSPAAVAFLSGELIVSDGETGAIGHFNPYGSGGLEYEVISEGLAAASWLGGGVQFARGSFDTVFGNLFGLTTSEGFFEYSELGSVQEISRNGRDYFDYAGAVAVRVAPETSPDLNQDGCVDGGDLSLMLSFFNEPTASFHRADLDLNGMIDGADLSILLGDWTGCP
ncbi:MAG: M12 family metallo-peptidase [Phycisphaerales bacterium]|nr:M12 family metallo-peptidase [Phycisphaerales bacterium]